MQRLLRSILYFVFLVYASTFSLAAVHPQVTLTGVVMDTRTHLPVDAADVSVVETHTRAAADSSGVFRVTLPGAGRYTLAVRRLGYAASERTLTIDGGGTVVDGQGRDHLLADLLEAVKDDDAREAFIIRAAEEIIALVQGASIVVTMQPVVIAADEVIIRSTRLQSTPPEASPMPISILTSEDIALRPSLTSADALTSLPGVTLVRDGAWETAVSIRGMSRSNIVMMIDNTRIETANDIAGAFSLVDVHELERVELVHSPGSSLWGSGAVGGVVHLMTKQPSFSASPASHLQFDEEAASVNGLFSHHLAFDHSSPRLGFRLGLGYRNAGATMTPDGAIANSQFRDMNLNASLAAVTFGAQTLSISYQRSQAENAGIPGGSAFATQAQARYTLARRELASLEYSLPDLSRMLGLLTFRASRQVIQRNVEVRQSPVLTLTPHAVHTTTSGEIESRLAFGSDLLVTAGVDCWERSLDSRRERVNSVLEQTIGERPVPASTYLSAGSYVHSMWSAVPERVTIDAGARFDLIRVKNDAAYNPEYIITGNVYPDWRPPTQILLWNARTEWNRSWSANAGATVSLSRAADLSCLAAASFRSPSLEERFQFIDLGSIVRVGDPGLKPEESTSLNLGFSFHEDRTSLRADVFANRLTDLVTEIPGLFEGRPALVKANIGEAMMYGFECSAAHPLSSILSIGGSLAYVHGEDRHAHAPLPQIPPLTGTVTVSAFIPPAGQLSADATGALKQDRIAAGEIATPAYGVTALRFASVPVRLFRTAGAGIECVIRCGVENLFDHSYRLHVSTLRGVIRQEPGRNAYLSASIAL